MESKQNLSEWSIWIIISAPFLIILLQLNGVAALFWEFFSQKNGTQNGRIMLWVLPILNIIIYFLGLTLKRKVFHTKNYELAVYNARFLFQIFISALFTIFFLQEFGQIQLTYSSFNYYLVLLVTLFIGYFLRYLKPNREMGIRLPWTLSNDINWEKTHQFTSTLWVTSAITAILVFPAVSAKYHILFLSIFIVFLCILPTLYSYRLHQTNKEATLRESQK